MVAGGPKPQRFFAHSGLLLRQLISRGNSPCFVVLVEGCRALDQSTNGDSSSRPSHLSYHLFAGRNEILKKPFSSLLNHHLGSLNLLNHHLGYNPILHHHPGTPSSAPPQLLRCGAFLRAVLVFPAHRAPREAGLGHSQAQLQAGRLPGLRSVLGESQLVMVACWTAMICCGWLWMVMYYGRLWMVMDGYGSCSEFCCLVGWLGLAGFGQPI